MRMQLDTLIVNLTLRILNLRQLEGSFVINGRVLSYQSGNLLNVFSLFVMNYIYLLLSKTRRNSSSNKMRVYCT